MAFIYNLSDTWNDAATTWNGIKLAVTNSGSDSSSKLLNLTVTGASTASFVVDKSGNLVLNGSVNKITFTAPATGATLTLADNSTFATSGAYTSTFTFTGTTTLTFPTSGTVTALGNTTTGSGSIVLATSPTLVTPALGTPSSGVLSSCTGYAVGNLTGTGTGVLTALAVNVGSAGAFVTFNGALGTPSSGNLGNCTGYPSSGLTGLGTGVATALAVNVGSAGAFVVNGGALGTPSSGTLTNATGLPISTGVDGLGSGVATFLATPTSANLAAAVTNETGSGPLVFATSPTFTSQVTFGTASSTRGTLVLANTTANTVTLQSSNSTAAAYTLTFPAAAPINGYYLQTDSFGQLSWAAGGGGGGGSPGGSNTQVQYNNAGAFGGSPGFTFNGTATVGLGVASTTSGVFNLYNSLSANAVSLKSGNNASAWSFTLPTGPGTNGYALTTDGSGNTSWTSIQSGLAVGTTAITGGTSGRILYDNAGVLGELATTGSGNVVLATSPTITTPTISGNETHTGTAARFIADFDNATVNSRFAFQTTTTNASTGIYALPNGTSTAASWQAANAADPTNASKILIATNASTDVQLVSGINGTGTYLPLSIYTSGGQSAQFSTTKGTFTLGVQSTTAGILTFANTNAGAFPTSIQSSASATASWTLTLPTAAPATAGSVLTSTTGGVSSWTATLPVANGGTGTATAFTAGSVVFAGASGTYSQDNANFFWDNTNKYLSIGNAAFNVLDQVGGTRPLTVSASSTSTTVAGSTACITIANSDTTTNNTSQLLFAAGTGAASAFYGSAAISCIFGARTSGQYPSGQLAFSTSTAINVAPAEKMRLDNAGNLLLGSTAARGTTVGTAHLDLFNGTAPAGTLTNGISLYSSSGDFNFMDSSGNGYKVGFRNIPQNSQTANYTLVISDVGKHISITTGGVNVPISVFSAGDVVSVFNNSGSSQNITQNTNVTLRLAGTATTGTRALAQYGVATILCIVGGATPTFVVSGAGVT